MVKLKKILLNLWYGLPFGLKGADTEIMGENSSTDNDVSVKQETSDQRVGKHLLKGEVTNEVEELRYRTYKVAGESENYDYLGNGVAVKNVGKKININSSKFKFSQENNLVCNSVLDELQHVDDYGFEKYTFEITYKDVVRFKIEQFATSVDVDIDTKNNKILTSFHFESQANPYDSKSKLFVNELEKLLNAKSEYEIKRSEFYDSMTTFSFSTYKANGESNFVNYSFIDGCKLKSVNLINQEYILTYEWDSFIRLPLNLEQKYFSKSMSDKYDRKEKKEVAPEMVQSERKRYCSVCGREMSVYDADIQEADGKPIICQDCMKKVFEK